MTTEMVEYIMLFSRKDLIYALKQNDHNGDYDSISRTIAALTVVKVAIENDFDFNDLKSMLK